MSASNASAPPCERFLPARARGEPVEDRERFLAIERAVLVLVIGAAHEVPGDVLGAALPPVAQVRRELRGRGVRPDPATWERALGGDLSQLVATGDGAEARARLVARLTLPCP